MVIAVSSTSFPEELAAYAVSRLTIGRVIVLWLMLSACTIVVSRDTSLASVMFSNLLLATLIVQFRLWDDLADRDFDAAVHPQRVLVVTGHGRRFTHLCGLLTLPVAVALVVGLGIIHLLVYVALLAAMAALYATGGIAPSRLARAHLVLLKYPAFIWLCVRDANLEQWLRIGIGAYLALCLFEIASDPDLRTGSVGRWLAIIETAALVALLIT